MRDPLDREEEILERQLADGEIDQAEFNRQMREAGRDYYWAAREAADRAAVDELEQWGVR
jgi:hypothetical protein